MILSQLEVMNDDFNRTNSDAFQIPSDFNSIVSSIQINFCLAKELQKTILQPGLLENIQIFLHSTYTTPLFITTTWVDLTFGTQKDI